MSELKNEIKLRNQIIEEGCKTMREEEARLKKQVAELADTVSKRQAKRLEVEQDTERATATLKTLYLEAERIKKENKQKEVTLNGQLEAVKQKELELEKKQKEFNKKKKEFSEFNASVEKEIEEKREHIDKNLYISDKVRKELDKKEKDLDLRYAGLDRDRENLSELKAENTVFSRRLDIKQKELISKERALDVKLEKLEKKAKTLETREKAYTDKKEFLDKREKSLDEQDIELQAYEAMLYKRERKFKNLIEIQGMNNDKISD